MFPRPTQNVIFLATFHKFLQFCLSNSDVLTTFGHFSQKSPLCRCGSYTHGSHDQRLMVSTEIIKNFGGGAKWGGGAENNFGGAFAPPSPPPLAPPLPTNLRLKTLDQIHFVLLYSLVKMTTATIEGHNIKF